MNKDFSNIPPNKRKKILLLCDDIRTNSGVGTIAREIIVKTSHHFNWVQIAGVISHPEKGKRLDISQSVNELTGNVDSSVILYPSDGYGTQNILRSIIQLEKPDAVMLFTDPRQFTWVFEIEEEIRKTTPIAYLNIWDNYPTPMYNQPYYEACDLLMGISKQTVNINRLVLGDRGKDKIFRYIPHGLDHNLYFPIKESDKEYKDLQQTRSKIFEGDDVNFVLFFNSRNIRRKQIPDVIMAYKNFLDTLPKEKSKKCRLILHTEITSPAGTNLEEVSNVLLGEEYSENIIFSLNQISQYHLNLMYNIADAQILISSNEGWGLSITEAMLTETPFIANVTGGMQDQMGFIDENDEWYTPTVEIPSNHKGDFKNHGEWAFPIFPISISLQGTMTTPYIYEDRCSIEDVTSNISQLYNLGDKQRKQRGKLGREWAMKEEIGLNSNAQANRVIEAFDTLFNTWKPKN